MLPEYEATKVRDVIAVSGRHETGAGEYLKDLATFELTGEGDSTGDMVVRVTTGKGDSYEGGFGFQRAIEASYSVPIPNTREVGLSKTE